MAQYINIQTSLLRYCIDTAQVLKRLTQRQIKELNLDAYANEDELPDSDFIGVENLALQSSDDRQPMDSFSAVITVSTQNDINNMRLVKMVDHIYESLRPTKSMTLFDETSGARVGKIICSGQTSILPVQDGERGRVFQAVVFQGIALDESIN
jgi:hypothetical protein